MSMVANSGTLSYRDIVQLAGNHAGAIDVACPARGPERRSPANRRRNTSHATP